jgi:hypothetical protein
MSFDIIESIYQQKKQQKTMKYFELCEKLHDEEEFINSVIDWIVKLLYQEQHWVVEKFTFHFSFKMNFNQVPTISINEKFELTEKLWMDLIMNHYDKIINKLPLDQIHLIMGYQGIFGYPRNRIVKKELETLEELDNKISELETKYF